MISILLSAYNGEKFIIEQLESLKKQTMQADEVIIIDDNSTDSTYEKCLSFINTNGLNKTWKLIKNDINKGWRYNFHFGVNFTHGDYIFYCDQDDIWYEDKIKVCFELMNDDLNALGTNEKQLYNNGNTKYLNRKGNKLNKVDFVKEFKDIRCNGCSMVVRRKFLNEIESYYIDCWAHDAMVWQLATINNTFGLYEKDTLIHRIHGGNVTSAKHRNVIERVENLKHNILINNQIIKYINDNFKDKIAILNIYKKMNEALSCRINYLQFHKTRGIHKLLKYYKYLYSSPKQLLGDIYVSFIRNGK